MNKASHALPRKILAAVDLSRPEDQVEGLNDQIISEALKLALQCNAQIDLLYVYDLGSMYVDAGGGREHSFLFDTNLFKTLHEAQSEAFRRWPSAMVSPPSTVTCASAIRPRAWRCTCRTTTPTCW